MPQQGDLPLVAVVGAGPAGLAATVAAARSGVRTCLIERSHRIGGSATDARVGTVCGLSLCGTSLSKPPSFDNPGFALEFCVRLAELSGTSLTRNEAGLAYLPYSPQAFETAALEQLAALGDRTMLCCSEQLASARFSQSTQVFELELKHSSITAHAVVDCSGDAVVSRLLGFSVLEPNPPQAGALVFELHGLTELDEALLGFIVRKTLREGVLANDISERLSYVSLVPGSLRSGSAAFKLGTQPTEPDLPARSHSAIERQARTDILTLVAYLASRGGPLKSARIGIIADALGIRAGGRGKGETILSEQDITQSKRSPSGIALGFWPLERWDTASRPLLTFPQQGRSYEIPLGALCSHEQAGLYFAGRSISATDEAIASARVMGTCLSTGYATGRIAAGHLCGEERATIISKLRAEQVEPFYKECEVGIGRGERSS
jgi:hypothetical protein